MRSLIILTALSFALAFTTGPAWASKRLSGQYTKAQVKKDCDAAGGTYGEGSGGSYGCDGPNGTSVVCGGSTCYGDCGWKNPDCAFRRKGVSGFLHQRPPSAGIKSGRNTRQRVHRHPVKIGIKPPGHHRRPVKVGGVRAPVGSRKNAGGNSHPVIMMHAAQHHGGGRHN